MLLELVYCLHLQILDETLHIVLAISRGRYLYYSIALSVKCQATIRRRSIFSPAETSTQLIHRHRH